MNQTPTHDWSTCPLYTPAVDFVAGLELDHKERSIQGAQAIQAVLVQMLHPEDAPVASTVDDLKREANCRAMRLREILGATHGESLVAAAERIAEAVRRKPKRPRTPRIQWVQCDEHTYVARVGRATYRFRGADGVVDCLMANGLWSAWFEATSIEGASRQIRRWQKYTRRLARRSGR